MDALDNILKELDEMYLLSHVTMKHDDARISYKLSKNTVSDDREFDDVIVDYYNHQFSKCISPGGSLSRSEALGHAKQIIEKECMHRGRDLSFAYKNGKTGYHGGMFVNINYIYEQLKRESVERHIQDVLDRYIAPTSFEEQVKLIKEIFRKIGMNFNYYDFDHPETYVKNYDKLARGLANCIYSQASKLRRFLTYNYWVQHGNQIT